MDKRPLTLFLNVHKKKSSQNETKGRRESETKERNLVKFAAC